MFDVIPSKRTKKGGKRRNGNVSNEPYEFDPSMFMVDIMDANIVERKFLINHVRNKVMHLNLIICAILVCNAVIYKFVHILLFLLSVITNPLDHVVVVRCSEYSVVLFLYIISLFLCCGGA